MSTIATSIQDLYSIYQSYPLICIDSRKSVENSFFFAVGRKDDKGYHFGNRYAVQAIESGKASYAVINDKELKEQVVDDPRFLWVEDVEESLQMLASYHRSTIDAPILAVAGSNGKTTTKELLKSCFSRTKKIFTTPGNLNNHLGVPLSLLSIRDTYDLIVLEIGANHLGETRFLADMIKPDYGLVTNNGKDHIGEYGSVENIMKANKELFDHLAENNRVAFVNQSDSELVQMSTAVKQKIVYGSGSACSADVIQGAPLQITLNLHQTSIKMNTPLFGAFWLDCVLSVICISDYFGLPIEDIKNGLANYQPKALRSQWIRWNEWDIMLDCYNANPTSMSAFLDEIYAWNSYANPYLIIGEMKELGHFSEEEHRLIFNQIDLTFFEAVVLIGQSFKVYADLSSKISWFEKISDMPKDFLLNNQTKGAV